MSDHKDRHYAVLIYDVSRLVRKRFGERIRELGFTELRWRIIAFLLQRPGLNQTELADLLDMEKAPLGNAVDKLRLEGWIRRETDSRDKRAKRLYLSQQCDPVAEKMQIHYEQILQEVTRGIAPTALAQSLQTLKCIATALRGQTAPSASIAFNTLSKTTETARLLKKRFSAPIKELGFTPSQWLVLVTVAYRQGETQTRIAKQLDLGKAPLGQLLDELEKNQWLTRAVDTEDRRAKRLHLTVKARDMLAQQAPRFTAIHDEVVGDIDNDSLATLSNTLHQIRCNLKAAASSTSKD